MKLPFIFLTATLICLEHCLHIQAWYQPHIHGPRRPIRGPVRDRPRPLRHHRHIQPHHGNPKVPLRMQHHPHRPPPPGHRRISRPHPLHPPFAYVPPYTQSHSPAFVHDNHGGGGSMMMQPAMHNAVHHHPPQFSHSEHHILPPPYFKQDEIIQAQSKHFPVVSAVLPPVPPSSPPTVVSFSSSPNEIENQPNQSPGQTSKGWKPIIKPHYQNIYHAGTNMVNSYEKPQNEGEGMSQSSQFSKNWNMDTLFREHTEHMKVNLKPAFSENQGVKVPPPQNAPAPQVIKPIKAIDITPSWNRRVPSEGGRGPVIVKRPILKPSPSYHNKENSNSNPSPSSSGEQSGEGPKIQKFKIRRPVPNLHLQIKENHGNEQTKVSSPSNNEEQANKPLNLKEKLTTRGRVRVRTKIRQPPENTNNQQNDAKENQNNDKQTLRFPPPQEPPPGIGSGPPTFPPHETFPMHQMNFGPFPTMNEPNSFEQQSKVDIGPPPPQQQQFHSEVNQNLLRRPQVQKQQNQSRRPSGGSVRGNRLRPQHKQSQSQNQAPPVLEFQHSEPPNFPPPPTFFGGGSPESEEAPVTPPPSTTPKQRKRQRERQNNVKNNKNNGQQPPSSPPNSSPPSFQQDPPAPPVFGSEGDSYFPPGFHGGPGESGDPVSFIAMPGSKPRVIHHTYHPPPQQQVHPITFRPPSDDFSRPVESHGNNALHENYVPNNRPHFATINVHRPPPPPPPPPRYPQNQHNNNVGPVFPSNSDQEPAYHPVPFGLSNNNNQNGGPFGPPMGHMGPRPSPSSFPMRQPMPPPPPHHHHHNHPPHPPHSHAPPHFHRHHHPHGPPPVPSTTIRYPRYHSSSPPPSQPPPPQSPQEFPTSSYASIEMQDHSEPTNANPQYEDQNRNNNEYPSYAPSYVSAEYEQIPAQFVEHLKPILTEPPPQSQGLQEESQAHHPPHMPPPPSFFDDFFRPFDQPFNSVPDQELDDVKPLPTMMQIQGPSSSSYQNYNDETFQAEQSSPMPNYAMFHIQDSSAAASSSSNQYRSGTTTTGNNNNNHQTNGDGNINETPGGIVWSKSHPEENNDVDVNLANKFTSLKKQPKVKSTTTSAAEEESQVEEKTEEIPPVTTFKSSLKFYQEERDNGGMTTEKQQDLRTNPEKVQVNEEADGNGRHPQHDDDDDDVIESNIPKRIRIPAAETTERPETTTNLKSRRHFRRRRPDATVRRRFFSSRVKSNDKEETNLKGSSVVVVDQEMKEEHNPIAEHRDGYETSPRDDSSSIPPVKQRRFLHSRRRISPLLSSHKLNGMDDTYSSSSSTQASAETDPAVTYGESQWFKIRPTSDSTESPFPYSKRISSKNKEGLQQDATTIPSHRKGTSERSLHRHLHHPEYVSLEPTSTEPSSTEGGGVKTSYSSKHTVSFIDSVKAKAKTNNNSRFPVHRRKQDNKVSSTATPSSSSSSS